MCKAGRIENSNKPNLFDQHALNDLIRDLGLPKLSAELLASRLKERNLLAAKTKVSYCRDREKSFLKFFCSEDNFVFCHDIVGFLNALCCKYVCSDWRLFIDSSKASLKCVLLSSGNQYASIPIGHSVLLKESYDTMALVLQKLKYCEHNWMICGDLKVIFILLGQQVDLQSTLAFCVFGTAGLAKSTGLEKTGPQKTSSL